MARVKQRGKSWRDTLKEFSKRLDWRKENTMVYVLGGYKKNIAAVAELYKSAKEMMGLEKTDVPYLKAEDETAIIPRPEYNAVTDEVWGFCGKKNENHICEENFLVKVGDDDEAYDRLVDAFQGCQVATYARVIMINLLHQKLPRMVLLLQATCNRFTHNELLNQWLVLDSLCESVLDPVLGPGIGHSSDGDSRRRKLMLNQAVSAAHAGRYRPVPIDLGFIMSVRIEVTDSGRRLLKDLYDQDSIHNDKKIINLLDHTTRVLQLGRYSAHMNHLRLVMTTFPPAIHCMHADDVARKDRQKWEVVQQLKFKSVQQCLLDIANGNGVNKDASVYGTWAFLYVAWHYTEIFFSLHASLRDRVKYAAFVAIFYSLWRNWIILTEGQTLKVNFLTRECFQDVLLSCHFAVILISHFRDEHPDLEWPLDLSGTDCCERYFSENGSFVQNRHNYTFLDIHRNLGYMNRLQEIRATNPAIKFPNRKHNNDFIWDKQFPVDQRKRVCDLKDYPSPDEVVSAWKEGAEMARSLARELGMGPDDNAEIERNMDDDSGDDGDNDDDDDDKWFHKPMEYVGFDESLRGMVTEEERECLRREARNSLLEDHEDNEDESAPSNENDDEDGDIRHIVNPLLDSLHPETEEEKKINATLVVPGVGRRYKSTIIAELRNDPNLSTDRLRRVRAAAPDPNTASEESGNSAGLFDDCAFYDPNHQGNFVLGRVQRMRKKGNKGFVEYVRPVDLDNKPADVEVLFSVYQHTGEENSLSYFHTETVRTMALGTLVCKITMQQSDHDGAESDKYQLSERDASLMLDFAERQTHHTSSRRRPHRGTSHEEMPDDGRRVDTVSTSRGRLSSRVSYLS